MTRREIAKQLIEEKSIDGVCTLSKKKLAEVLFKRYPDLYLNTENARTVVRSITDSLGNKTRKERMPSRIKWNGFTLPEQEKNDYSKVILNEKRIGILSDIHFPYADMTALNAAVDYLIDFKPDCIVLNGDTIDMYHGSDFEQDPRNRKPDYEFAMVRLFMGQLYNLFPKTRIIYKAGNHCERYEKKIMSRLPYFVDLKWMTLEFALNYEMPFKVEVVKNKRLIKAGNLNIAHGHEFAKGFIAPVNVARGFYLRAKANTIAGHHHRISEHMEQDINGKQIGAWSTGCLCELNPKYMPINNWQHGFATVEVINNEGDFRVKNLKIINGEVL